MNDYLKAQIQDNCDSINTGKPCSALSVKIIDSEEAKNIVIENRLNVYTKLSSDDWVEFWIFKRIELLKIIKKMPDNPKSNFDHFMLGCLFGYDINSILDFINKLNGKDYNVSINDKNYNIPEDVFNLLKHTSIERDNYKLFISN